MLKALVLAFSLYTRLPMPYIRNAEKSMKYTLSWFPMTGVILDIVQALVLWGASELSLSSFFIAVLMTVIPIMYTGGIHVDGLMDTTDAVRSYRSKEEKIAIMDDPHSGAFSIIGLSVYLMVSVALCEQLFSRIPGEYMPGFDRCLIFIGSIYVMSRSVSAITSLILPKAKKSGMLYEVTGKALGCKGDLSKACILPACFLIGSVLIQMTVNVVAGASNLVVQFLLYLYYRKKCDKEFGGITGDTAGWLLCMSELLSLVVLAVCVTLNIGG